MNPGADVLSQLYQTLVDRKQADASRSYVAGLYAKGVDAILKKVAEEAGETVIAGKNADSAALVHEIADLWFHTLVLMAAKDIPLSELTGELAGRFGRSGLEEKAARAG
jgi:phosphoribosyl-ATP pyrophosphohydrolase